jgi:hypothetical protein
MKINQGAFYRGMAQKFFDGKKVGSLRKEMGCEAMPEGMDPLTSYYTGFFFAMT